MLKVRLGPLAPERTGRCQRLMKNWMYGTNWKNRNVGESGAVDQATGGVSRPHPRHARAHATITAIPSIRIVRR